MADFLILDDDKKSESDKNVNNNSPKASKSFMDAINEKLLTFQKIKTSEKVIFYRLLSTMTNAWMWVMKAVSILEKQEKNPVFKKILWVFVDRLRQWDKFSDCIADYPNSFEEAEVWIIKSWEKTWQLNTVLTDLANQIEKVESISGKIKSAMMYPMFILVVVVAVIVVMMVVVVPKLLAIFEWKWDLPASTQALIAISDFFTYYWYLIIIFVVWFVIFISFWKKTPDGKYMFDSFKMKVPVFWEINKKLVLSKFSRVFAWLVGSWVSIVESLKITSDAVGNEVYKQRIILLSEDIAWGIKMWESLDWDKLFPDMMVQMIQVWEETAKLDSVITKVADFYDDQVDNTIWVINKLLEPFIIVTLAVVVWFIAIAIMQPIMNLADTVTQ